MATDPAQPAPFNATETAIFLKKSAPISATHCIVPADLCVFAHGHAHAHAHVYASAHVYVHVRVCVYVHVKNFSKEAKDGKPSYSWFLPEFP